MGEQWTAEFVAGYQRWKMANPGTDNANKSTNLDFDILRKMVAFSLYSDGKPCGEASFTENQLHEGDYSNCWSYLNIIPQRLYGWQVWEKVNALYVKSKTEYPKRGQIKNWWNPHWNRQNLATLDRMVDLYCQATGYNMLPLFDWYNINELSELNPTVRENCANLPESNLLTEWLNVARCVKESMNGVKEITECEDMPSYPPPEGE